MKKNVKENDTSFIDTCFNFMAIILLFVILIMIGGFCKIFFFTDAIQIDKNGVEYMDVSTVFINNYEEGKNKDIEDFFIKNIKVNDKLTEEDKKHLDEIFSSKNNIDKESFKAAAKVAINYLNEKSIFSETTKFSFKEICNLINPLDELEVNYIYIDIFYDKKDTFLFHDDEFIITYIVL